MELGIGLFITIAIAMHLASGGTLPRWFLTVRLLAVPVLFTILLFLFLLA